METTVKSKKEVAQPISTAFAKMIERKREIQNHIQNGGTFKELTEKGYKFAQPL